MGRLRKGLITQDYILVVLGCILFGMVIYLFTSPSTAPKMKIVEKQYTYEICITRSVPEGVPEGYYAPLLIPRFAPMTDEYIDIEFLKSEGVLRNDCVQYYPYLDVNDSSSICIAKEWLRIDFTKQRGRWNGVYEY